MNNENQLTQNEQTLFRLYAAHSALFIFTNTDQIKPYLEKIICSIPGVKECEVCLIKTMDGSNNELQSKLIGTIDLKHGTFSMTDFLQLFEAIEDKEIQIYSLFAKDIFYGLIIIKISDFNQFNLFDSIVNSFTISTSIILENLCQRYILEKNNKELSMHREHLSELVKKKTQSLRQAKRKLQDILDKTIESLASITEQHDPYTAGHQFRVAKLAEEIAKNFGLSSKKVHEIYLGALIHDIGKTRVPMEILVSPAKLSPLEYEFIKIHPEVGYQIAKRVAFNRTIFDIILHHHERLDGSGYPHGLKADEIRFETKIVTVADVFEAMSSHRPYRPKNSIEATLNELQEGAGKRYDSAVVACCIELITKKNFEFPTPPYERLNVNMYAWKIHDSLRTKKD
ncbi:MULTISPECIES: HD-GYP domain-containing protein [unclassified Legionella]|uniref:HD-GYP domain-containing protein n=1 Tax=unclassified Legionella TaxID=2622702 RepID=UPI001E4A7604|nr:HD-GYP domain-containing protein [Legionella sp. 31fI33]MCC5013799.1 HD-GYP domain-containing protein [Legionella sp. 31fI33]